MIDPSLFLRRIIQADAIITGAMAVLLVAAAGLLSSLLDLPENFLREVGIFLIVYAALVGFLSTRTLMPKLAVWAVIAANAVWTIDSIALLFTGWVEPNLLGQAFIVAQALSVAVIAELQYIGLRRSEALAQARSDRLPRKATHLST